jgi:FKBP-type peptidyl-prolyl cis-trans isomerase
MLRRGMVVLTVAFLAAQVGAEEKPALKTQKEKASYALGVDIGKKLAQLGDDIDAEALVQGLKDAQAGKKLQLTDEELQAAIEALQTVLTQNKAKAQAKAAAAQAKEAEENKKAGDAFLAENKKKKGVVTLPSGLQYQILKEGTGKKPTANDTVECQYRGTLLDGTEFDSSYRRGEPATFPVSRVIAGWTEALQLMPVGSKWKLFIPSQLAYKDRSPGHVIGPNATLIFEVELIAIK